VRQLLSAVSVLAVIGAAYSALTGEYGLAWQVMSLVLTLAVELMGLLAGLALLMQKFGRGRMYSPPVTNPAASSEEVLAHDTSDSGAVESQRETTDRDETKPDNLKARAVWFPHPDDPPPAEASQTPKGERGTTLTPPSHPPI
jgi:hypothetical protein